MVYVVWSIWCDVRDVVYVAWYMWCGICGVVYDVVWYIWCGVQSEVQKAKVKECWAAAI